MYVLVHVYIYIATILPLVLLLVTEDSPVSNTTSSISNTRRAVILDNRVIQDIRANVMTLLRQCLYLNVLHHIH